jgi:hypothetical protein
MPKMMTGTRKNGGTTAEKAACGKTSKTVKPSPARTTVSAVASSPAPRITAEERHRLIAETAYFKAEKRGFQGGDPVKDWLEAEAEVDRKLGLV